MELNHIKRNNNGWFQYIKTAMCSHVLLKSIGITIFISLFFIAYFYILNHPAFSPTTIPLTFLDKLISFQPLALPVYLSLWPYVVMPAILLTKLDELYVFTVSIALMSMAGLTIFYIWPTTIPLNEIDWRLYPSISFLKSVDAAGNACPSLHVATAIFAGHWTAYLFRRIQAPRWIRVANVIWCIGIIYSTIALRQHVALDALAGMLLGYIAIYLVSITAWKSKSAE